LKAPAAVASKVALKKKEKEPQATEVLPDIPVDSSDTPLPVQPEIESNKPKIEAEPTLGSAAADSPYNQPNVTIDSVEDEARKSWMQELYLYLVQ
jgi:hypothetical protein